MEKSLKSKVKKISEDFNQCKNKFSQENFQKEN